MPVVQHSLTGSVFDSTNLTGYYQTETNWTDLSGLGNNFTNISASAPTFITGGRFSKCAHFVKTSTQYAGTGNSMSIDGGTITMCCWARITGQPAGGAWFNFIFQANATSKTVYYINYMGTGPVLRFSRYKGGGTDQQADYSTTLTPAVWYHVCLTYDLTNVVGYLNGVQVATIPATGSGTVSQGTGFFASYPNAPCACLNGDVDEILCFTRVWSAAEVYNYYQQYASAMVAGANF